MRPFFAIMATSINAVATLFSLQGTQAAESTASGGPLKVAAVQTSGYDKTDLPGDKPDPTDKIVQYIHNAGADNVQLVVFPEYVLGRISVPGETTHKIAAAAAANHLYVIAGCWEVREDGSFANAALLFDREGKIAGRYYKTHAAVDKFEGDPPWVHPPGGKDLDWFIRNDPEWKMERGNDLPVFETDFGKIGIITCYDGWFPESFRVLSLKGAELLVWINGRRGSVEDFIVKSAVFQNHIAIISTNQAYGAGTMIADWPARILAQCPPQEDAYITATIHLDTLRRVRHFSRNFRQRRPDLYDEITRPLAHQKP